MYSILQNMKAALSAISGVATCRIGIENGLSPADYPIIRIVPATARHGEVMTRKKLSVMVYYGAAITEADGGLEAVYAALCSLEQAVISALESAGNPFTAVWQETVTDEDRLEHYKLFVSRFDVVA